MLLCDWAALYSVAEQLAVRRVPRPLPSFAEVGVAMQNYSWPRAVDEEQRASSVRKQTTSLMCVL